MKNLFSMAVALVSALLSVAAWYFASGFSTPAEAIRRTYQERWWYMDGWPMFVEAALLGPTCAGPLIVWLQRSSLFSRPILSGANLWVGIGMASMPLLILLLLCSIFSSRAPVLSVAAFALWLLVILIRATAVSACTVAVLVRTSVFRGDTERWAAIDLCGIALGVIWSVVAVYQICSVLFMGLPK